MREQAAQSCRRRLSDPGSRLKQAVTGSYMEEESAWTAIAGRIAPDELAASSPS